MSVWTKELLEAVGIEPDPHDVWVMESGEILDAIRAGKLDLFSVTVQEYREVVPYVDSSLIITDNYGGEELLLVVREGSGIMKPEDLRGRSLNLWASPTMSLAEPWLTVALWQEGLESPQRLFARMNWSSRLTQVVLPLFFGQADACLVTRRGLDAMIELNPQLSRKVKVLIASPKMHSGFLAFRKDYPGEVKKLIFDRFLGMKWASATDQLMTMFQCSGFTPGNADLLSRANSLLDTYERGRTAGVGRRR